jgi:hypothetical protein
MNEVAPVLSVKPEDCPDGLTLKMVRFAEEYVVDMNAAQAAIRAGYPKGAAKQRGYENLRKQPVVDYITRLMAERSEATGVNRSWVLAQLVDTHSIAKSKETVGHVSARLKCLELIGRHVDVRAFRAGLGFSGGDDEGDGAELWDLSQLSDSPPPSEWAGLSEFEVFERLLAKVTIFKAPEGREGGAPTAAGPGSGSSGPGGDSVAL